MAHLETVDILDDSGPHVAETSGYRLFVYRVRHTSCPDHAGWMFTIRHFNRGGWSGPGDRGAVRLNGGVEETRESAVALGREALGRLAMEYYDGE